MTVDTLNTWIALFAIAREIGGNVHAALQGVAKRVLTPEENQAVLAMWDENAARSAANAGLLADPIDPDGDVDDTSAEDHGLESDTDPPPPDQV